MKKQTMKHSLRLIYMPLLAAILVACSGDTIPFNIPPTLTVSEATNIYRKGATISGTYTKVNDNSVVERFGLLYATNSLLGDADTIFATPAELAAGAYTTTLSSLNPSTTYYYATFATSSSIVKSETSHFTTLANSAPRLGELTVSEVKGTSCVLSTSVLDDGGSALTLRGFLYRKAPTDVSQLTIQDLQVNVADDSEAFTATLDGLEENTRYAVCAYAYSSAGMGIGDISYFTTLQMYIPILSEVTAVITDVAGQLRVTASVTSSILPIIERGFVYSTEEQNPTINNNKVVANGTDDSFTTILENLPSNSPVYIRAYAKTYEAVGYSETYIYTYSELITNTVVSVLSAFMNEGSSTLNVSASVSQTGSYLVLERGFVYSTDTQLPTVGNNRTTDATGTNQSFSASITDLIPNIKNYIRAYVRTSAGYSYGDTYAYDPDEWPTLSTLAATNILEYSAQLNASIDVKQSHITECKFLWSRDNSNPQLSDGVLNAEPAAAVSATLSGLNGNTSYYYRSYVRHQKGVIYGSVKQFRTLLVEQAVLSATSVSNVLYKEATFTATVTATNNGTITDVGFVYSTSNNPTLANSRISAGTGTSLSAVCSSLQSGTTYYVRAYATNEKGTAYGPEKTFTTKTEQNDVGLDTYDDDTTID